MWTVIGCQCKWTSEKPYSLVASGRGDSVVAVIAQLLGANGRQVAKHERPDECLAELDRTYTSVDIIGHVRNGAIGIGRWQLSEPLCRDDVAMFKALADQMMASDVRLLRLLGCGALINHRAARALVAAERLLSSVNLKIFGTRTKIDETSFDATARRFRNDLDCAVLSQPRVEFLSALGILTSVTSRLTVTQWRGSGASSEEPYALSVALAQREVAMRTSPRWPIVVSHSLSDCHRFVSALRPWGDAADLAPDKLLCEVAFVDPRSPERSVRAFVWDGGARTFVRMHDMRLGQTFAGSPRALAPREGGELRC